MLKTRIITALLLFVFFVSALFFSSPAVWVVLATAVAALAAWEWGALQAFGARSRVALAVAVLLFAALIASLHPEALGLGSGFSYQAGWGLGRWFYVPLPFSGCLWFLSGCERAGRCLDRWPAV